LRATPFYGIVHLGKGGEGPGTETTPAKLELNPAVGSSHTKETSHGREEEEKGEDEDEVNDMSASLVLGPRRQLQFSRGA
jgi:hypothetical protein